MVPRNRTRVLSKESFMVSAKEEEERISSPIETVSWTGGIAAYVEVEWGQEGNGEANVFQHLDLGTYAFQFVVVLVLEF